MSKEAVNGGGARRISPAKLSHAVLRTTRLKEMVEWYKTPEKCTRDRKK
jgi:hypothetical protein